MKAILEFDLDNDEDKITHMKCIKGPDMAAFIWELQHNFWRKWKHNEESFTLDNYKEALSELLDGYNINIEEL